MSKVVQGVSGATMGCLLDTRSLRYLGFSFMYRFLFIHWERIQVDLLHVTNNFL